MTAVTRRLLTSRRASRTVATAGIIGAVVLLSGCSELSPLTTNLHYDAADGVSGTVGTLQLSDVLIVAPAQNKAGMMHGMVTNNGDAPVTMSMNADGTKISPVTVPAMASVRLDGQANGNGTATASPVEVPKVSAAPGKNVTVTFGSSSVGNIPLNVPVLLDQYPYGSASPTHTPDEQPTQGGDIGLDAPASH